MVSTRDLNLKVRTIGASRSSATAGRPRIQALDIDLGPDRQPRDQAALLLSVAAEVEHALMVQYLFAAYSVRTDQSDNSLKGQTKGIADRLLQIAREEMGHLITVQNLLHLIGAPIHFERQHSPFESTLYPFRFKLEPLSSGSLAKYVTAESPLEKPQDWPDQKWRDVLKIADEAQAANDGQMIRHVGMIYEKLIELFQDQVDGVKDKDLVVASAPMQARYEDWGYNPGPGDSRRVMVDAFVADDPSDLRSNAVKALEEIAEQGEGTGVSVDSHFERFLEIYEHFHKLAKSSQPIVWPLATNPSVITPDLSTPWDKMALGEAVRAAHAETGQITDERTLNWAHLFNFRYRLLLSCLSHYLRLKQANYELDGERKGDRTPRGYLLKWSFDEMRRVKRIAQKLVGLPLRDPSDGRNAGPPFQLPYTLALPDIEASRWRAHLDVLLAVQKLVNTMRADPFSADANDPFLEDLLEADKLTVSVVGAFASGQNLPESALPTDFQKVVGILEDAVRGFSIDVHENFWTGKTRDEFVSMHMFNRAIIGSNPQDNCSFDADRSQLMNVLNSSMPRFRPRVPFARFEYIREWINRQAPDNQPPNQIGLRHERSPLMDEQADVETVGLSESPQSLSYRSDIRPLFREFDRVFLKRLDGIDLDDESDVKTHAAEIAARLKSGTLPYDINWSAELIRLFEEWTKQIADQ